MDTSNTVDPMYISIVSPVYRAENLVAELVARINRSVGPVTSEYEVILVEDGSPDGSWAVIERICAEYPRVKGIKLSRNFGQHYAITAGLAAATGTWVVVMDCDLQDQPEEIPGLLAKAMEGNDLVLACRSVRMDGWLKRISSRLFYSLFSYLTDSIQDPSVANFGIYHQRVIHAILSMGDQIRFFPTMSQWVGFKRAKLDVEHAARPEGGSSYTWSKMLDLAFNNIIAFSDKPLRLTVRLGLFISVAAFIMGGYFLIKYLRGEILVLGYASLILSIWFFSGLAIFILGIMGLYLGKVFEKVKSRPVYVVDKVLNE